MTFNVTVHRSVRQGVVHICFERYTKPIGELVDHSAVPVADFSREAWEDALAAYAEELNLTLTNPRREVWGAGIQYDTYVYLATEKEPAHELP